MTTIAELRAQLLSVPVALLGADERRVKEEALTSLDALAQFDIVPAAVAFVGSSGSGKSTIFNGCVGADVSPVSVKRPTTTRAIMAGSSGPVSLAVESEYVLVPSARPGVVFIDTPSWEHDPETIASVMAAVELVVVVLTPSRYADAAVSELVDSLPERRPSAVVVNRVDAEPEDVAALMDSVRELYGADVVELSEGGSVADASEILLRDLAIDTIGYQRGAVLRASGSSGARFLASAVTSLSTEIGSLAEVIDGATASVSGDETLPVLETWHETRGAIVNETRRRVAALDATLALEDGGDIAPRVRLDLDPWEGESLGDDLDSWHDRLTASGVANARMRWRKKSGTELIAHNLWKAGVHPGLSLPNRVQRTLGPRLAPTVAEAHEELVSLVDAATEARRQQWASYVAMLGSYTPGNLLAAADGFSPRGAARG
ncbi:MAG: GTPase [Acidimicrobiia bacterium]